MSRVLVVEDEPTNMAILTAYMRKAGHQIEQAMDGAEALDLEWANLLSPPRRAVLRRGGVVAALAATAWSGAAAAQAGPAGAAGQVVITYVSSASGGGNLYGLGLDNDQGLGLGYVISGLGA